MDRAEYKDRMARIDSLLEAGENEEALDLLDSVNWRKLHNVNFLLGGAERYEALKKTEDARELLEIAHERSPVGRIIIYRLAILCSRMGDFDEAEKYYQKFIELAPKDNIRFIIKYELYKEKKADTATLIDILEELRANELFEEWGFELACLYRETGQIDKCILLLDEIILWYGEGAYVDRAKELKIQLLSRGMSGQDMESDGQFDTQNLQAEIKRNIEEIMQASRVEEISGNMEALKELVEDIPSLKMEQPAEEDKAAVKRIDEELKSKFQEYLSEETDGQISIFEAGREGDYDQIEGQLTIEDVSLQWEKTSRAARQALLEAKEQELTHYKKEALEKANELLDKLLESDGTKEEAAFSIPVLNAGGNVVAGEFNIPIIKQDSQDKGENEYISPLKEPEDSGQGADMEDSESAAENEKATEKEAIEDTEPVGESVREDSKDKEEPDTEAKDSIEEQIQAGEEAPAESEYLLESEYALLNPEIYDTDADNADEAFAEDISEAETDKEESNRDLSPEETLKSINDMLQNEIDKLTREQNAAVEILSSEKEQDTKELLEEQPYSREEIESLPLEETLLELNNEEKKLLSYFAGIAGMESHIASALKAARSELKTGDAMKSGHIIIQGRRGSGKTRLARNMVKVLQSETGRLEGDIGRISAEKLNEKGVGAIIDKIGGGVLIIEDAGKLSNDSVVSLSISIERDDRGTLVVLEAARAEINELLKRAPRFAKKFSDPISIPVMTIDELVNFGKLYAAESGYVIDEMGILALYDRINIISTPARPATVLDIKILLDEAIEVANKTRFKGLRGLFKGKKGQAGQRVLQERDFRED